MGEPEGAWVDVDDVEGGGDEDDSRRARACAREHEIWGAAYPVRSGIRAKLLAAGRCNIAWEI